MRFEVFPAGMMVVMMMMMLLLLFWVLEICRLVRRSHTFVEIYTVSTFRAVVITIESG
jgi:hypothetical protein